MMISQVITGIGLFTIALVAFIYWRKSYFDQKSSEFYIIGIAIFFTIMGIYRFLFFYHDFFAPDAWTNVLWKIGNSFLLIGLTMLNYILERFIYKKSKYIFTIVGTVFVMLYIIIPEKNIARIISQLGSVLMVIFPLLIHIIIAGRSSGWFRRKAIIISIGIMILIFSTFGLFLFETFGILETKITLVIGHPLSLLGFIVTGYGLLMEFLHE
jgi:hypothetical protein